MKNHPFRPGDIVYATAALCERLAFVGHTPRGTVWLEQNLPYRVCQVGTENISLEGRAGCYPVRSDWRGGNGELVFIKEDAKLLLEPAMPIDQLERARAIIKQLTHGKS